MLLSKSWELYESDKRIEGFSPQTLKAYKLQSKLLIQHFIDVNIESLMTNQRFDSLNLYTVGHTRKGIYPKIQLRKSKNPNKENESLNF